MNKVMKVIREAHNTEKKRRLSSQRKKCEDERKRVQRAKTLICEIKGGRIRKEDIKRRREEIYGNGSSHEIERTITNEKMIERIEDMSRTDEQFETWEKMRKETKRKQREDKRLNLFWRKNRTFPAQF